MIGKIQRNSSLSACLGFLSLLMLAGATGPAKIPWSEEIPQDYFRMRLENRTIIGPHPIDEALTFKAIRQVAVDSELNVYVLDSKPAIVKCDPSGRLISVIGRMGSGPGEYRNPTAIFVDACGRLAVIDQNRFVIQYDVQGVYRNRIAVDNGIEGPFVVFPSGRITGFTRNIESDGIRKVLAIFDDRGRLEKKMGSWLETPLSPAETRRPGFVIGGIKHKYSPAMLLCPIDNNKACYGFNLKYELQIYDEEGTVITTISSKEPSITTRELTRELEKKWGKAYMEKFGMPPTKPYFGSVLSDDTGRIFIIRTPEFHSPGKTRQADVYSKSGDFLFRTEFPIAPSCIRNSSILAIDIDEEGWFRVEKYIILNGEDMPTGRR